MKQRKGRNKKTSLILKQSTRLCFVLWNMFVNVFFKFAKCWLNIIGKFRGFIILGPSEGHERYSTHFQNLSSLYQIHIFYFTFLLETSLFQQYLRFKYYTCIKCVIILTISSMEGLCEGSLDQHRVIKLSIGLGKFFISGGRVPIKNIQCL